MKLSTDQINTMKLSLTHLAEISSIQGVLEGKLAESKSLALITLNKLTVGKIDLNAEDLRILYGSLRSYKIHIAKSLNPLLSNQDEYFQAKHYLPVVDDLIVYLENEFSKFRSGREFLDSLS